jgi:hypothetical protein
MEDAHIWNAVTAKNIFVLNVPLKIEIFIPSAQEVYDHIENEHANENF